MDPAAERAQRLQAWTEVYAELDAAQKKLVRSIGRVRTSELDELDEEVARLKRRHEIALRALYDAVRLQDRQR